MNEHTKTKVCELNAQQQISFLVAVRTNAEQLAVEPVSGTIIEATSTAVRVALQAVRGRPRLIWLPRRALVRLQHDGVAVTGRLANWFQPNHAQARAFCACVRSSLQTN